MKGMRSLTIAAAIVLLAPMQLLAQQGGRGMGMGGGMGLRALLEQGSVEYLVTKAADLQLTAEQTADLKAIGEAFAEATKDDREKIRAEMPQGGGQGGMGAGGDRQAMMQRMQALRPHVEKLREEDEKSVVEALKLLNETQQAAARKLVDERRQPQGPPRG